MSNNKVPLFPLASMGVGAIFGGLALTVVSFFINVIPFFSGIGAVAGGVVGLALSVYAHKNTKSAKEMSAAWLALPTALFAALGYGVFVAIEHIAGHTSWVLAAGAAIGALAGRWFGRKRAASKNS